MASDGNVVEETVIGAKQEPRGKYPSSQELEEYVDLKPSKVGKAKDWLKEQARKADAAAHRIGDSAVKGAKWAREKKRELDERSSEMRMRAASYNAQLAEYQARIDAAEQQVMQNRHVRKFLSPSSRKEKSSGLTLGFGGGSAPLVSNRGGLSLSMKGSKSSFLSLGFSGKKKSLSLGDFGSGMSLSMKGSKKKGRGWGI